MIIDQVYCKKCGNEKEIWRNLNDKINEVCKVCGSNMSKSFTNLTYFLKGIGWTTNGTADYRKPEHSTEVGIKIDYNKKNEMQAAGEI